MFGLGGFGLADLTGSVEATRHRKVQWPGAPVEQDVALLGDLRQLLCGWALQARQRDLADSAADMASQLGGKSLCPSAPGGFPGLDNPAGCGYLSVMTLLLEGETGYLAKPAITMCAICCVS